MFEDLEEESSRKMWGVSRVKSMNVVDSEARAILVPAGNKAQRSPGSRKPVSKPIKKAEKSTEEVGLMEDNNYYQFHYNLSKLLHYLSNKTCYHIRASTGRIHRTRSSTPSRKKQFTSKSKSVVSDNASDSSLEGLQTKRRCAWVTTSTDRSYANFHDEEWGVPVHDDKRLFELLVLCGALAELTWPSILKRRHIFREVFADFDPVAVSKLNEKKILAPGSTACSLLSELKLRAVIENARQVSKITDEFCSFDKYIWSFVNQQPILGRFQYPHQVPVKTSKSEVISKDLVRRGFRGMGPTVVYSFMQVAGVLSSASDFRSV
ncbi:hypothetical protein KY289_031948 [Solanum tuberosum]|nr:hypothetical protein KY289_031948 [Solanum tuberosum]